LIESLAMAAAQERPIADPSKSNMTVAPPPFITSPPFALTIAVPL
jgi:hypothetical protein